MAPVSGLRQRGMLQGIGALVCISMLVTAFVLAAAADAPQSTQPRHQVDLSGLLTPTDETDPGVRRLPILDPEGPVVEGFPKGRGLDDAAKVRAVIDVLADRLGLLPVMDELLATSLVNPDYYNDLNLYQSYPYAYPAIDAIVDASLEPERVAADPMALLDLTGLLLLDAVRWHRDATYEDARQSWAGVAYSLLRRANQTAPSCDLALDLFFVMSMGFAPHILDVEAEARRALAACPGDPTPTWLLGQVQTGTGFSDRVVLRLRARTAGDGSRRRGHVCRAAPRIPGLTPGLGGHRRSLPPTGRRGRAAWHRAVSRPGRGASDALNLYAEAGVALRTPPSLPDSAGRCRSTAGTTRRSTR